MKRTETTLRSLPRDRSILYHNKAKKQLVVRVYDDSMSAERIEKFRRYLKMRGFRRDDLVRHRKEQIEEIEQWVFDNPMTYAGILLFIPALIQVHGLRYVTDDANDKDLRAAPDAVLKCGPGLYKHYQRAA